MTASRTYLSTSTGRLRALGGLMLLAVAGAASATTVVRQTVESLTDQSELVIRGVVERVDLHAPITGPPFRLAIVRVTESAGQAPARVPVRLPGGVAADGVECAVAGAPRLDEGDDVLLFLSRVPEHATRRPTVAPPARGRQGGRPATGPQPTMQWQPVALSLGTWRVTEDPAGAVAAPDAASRGLHQVGESAGTAPARTRLAPLLKRVRERQAARP